MRPLSTLLSLAAMTCAVHAADPSTQLTRVPQPTT